MAKDAWRAAVDELQGGLLGVFDLAGELAEAMETEDNADERVRLFRLAREELESIGNALDKAHESVQMPDRAPRRKAAISLLREQVALEVLAVSTLALDLLLRAMLAVFSADGAEEEEFIQATCETAAGEFQGSMQVLNRVLVVAPDVLYVTATELFEAEGVKAALLELRERVESIAPAI